MDQPKESEQVKKPVTVPVPWIERFDHRADGYPEGKGIGIDFLTLLQENEFR